MKNYEAIHLDTTQAIVLTKYDKEGLLQIEMQKKGMHFANFINIPITHIDQLIKALTKLQNNG